MGWIVRAWRGEERLWKAFWLYGVLLGIALGMLHYIARMFLGAATDIPYIVIRIIYGLWLIVAQWRCAFNAEWKIWGYVVRILIILGVVSIVLGFAVGGSLVGSDLIKAAECRKELKAYIANGGNDAEGFKKQCIERKKHPHDDAPGAVIDKPQVGLNSVSTEQDKYKRSCEQTMTDFSQKSGVDPQAYIAQNQAYLQQCIAYYQGKDALGNKN